MSKILAMFDIFTKGFLKLFVKQVIEKLQPDFIYKLVAGKEGLSREVRWIHMVETVEIATFLEGKEIVFTTGVGLNEPSELESLIECIIQHGASGIFLNTGPYIQEIPSTIINLCNEHNVPLFVVPWKVKMARMMRIISQLIIENEKKKIELEHALINLLISPSQKELYYDTLRENFMYEVGNYTLMIVKLDQFQYVEELKIYLDKKLNQHNHQMVISHLNQNLLLLMKDLSNNSAQQIQHLIEKKYPMISYTIAVGETVESLFETSTSYNQCQFILQLNQRENRIIAWDDLGSYKLFFGTSQTTAMRKLQLKYARKLMDHDQLYQSDYCQLVRQYIQMNGRVNDIAKQLFLHRNTIHYRLNKIEEILKCDLSEFQIKMEIELSFILDDLFGSAYK